MDQHYHFEMVTLKKRERSYRDELDHVLGIKPYSKYGQVVRGRYFKE